MWLTELIVLLIISNVYLSWSNTKPTGLISMTNYFQNVSQKGKFWELLQVISVPFIFIYNQIIGIFWLFKVVIKAFVWIFQNLIVDGIWLLLRLIYHYFILWPWRIFRLGFEQIKRSWNLSLYKIGAKGLFFTLLLIFIGRYLVVQYNYSIFIGFIFNLISIFPLANALAKTSSIRFASENSEVSSNNRITNYLLIFVALTVVLVGLDALVFYIGSFTFAAPIISSILSGGSMFLSVLLIFNCIVVFFMLSVFPQHLLHNSGDFKDTIRSFFSHILNNWPRYILGFFAAILPAAILSILPALLISGSVYLTRNIADHILKDRIEQKDKQVKDSTPPGQLSDWIDPKRMSADSALNIVHMYGKQKELEQDREDLQVYNNFFKSELTKYSNPIGAAPLFGLASEAYIYYQSGQRSLNVEPPLPADEAERFKQQLNDYEEQGANSIKMHSENLRRELEEGKSHKEQLEKDLENVCILKQPYSAGIIGTDEGATSTRGKSSIDVCEEKRKLIRSEIANQEKLNYDIEQKLSRLFQLKNEVDEIHKHLSENASSRIMVFSISFLFFGIWICLIVALCCGFWVTVFSNLNYAIYHDQDNQKWFITNLFQQANTRNRNQPLLGLIFTVLLLVFILINYCNYQGLNKFQPSWFKKLWTSQILSKPNWTEESKLQNPLQRYSEESSSKTHEEENYSASIDSAIDASASAAKGNSAQIPDTLITSAPSPSPSPSSSSSPSPSLLPAPNPSRSPNSNIESESKSTIDLNSYLVLVEKYATGKEAQQALNSYTFRGINLQIVTPGTFLGDNDDYYLLTAAFEVTLAEAQRIKNQINQQGVKCVIQKF